LDYKMRESKSTSVDPDDNTGRGEGEKRNKDREGYSMQGWMKQPPKQQQRGHPQLPSRGNERGRNRQDIERRRDKKRGSATPQEEESDPNT